MKPVIKIGRDNTNDIIINEPSISRNHAIVTNLGNGTYEVKDLGSSNGTFVNGQRIKQQVISPGDKLKAGSSMVDWQAAFQASPAKTDSVIQEDPFAKIRRTIMAGSADDNDIILNNTFVSAHHAKISVLKNGNYYLQDMGSSNGSFVNGSKVISKNFLKTDVVRVAGTELPNNWFLHKNLQVNFLKDHKKAIWLSLLAILIITGGIFSYTNCCSWFGWDCNLSVKQIYSRNQNTLAHIDHEYYYTIEFNGIKYYVGKNKNFVTQTEANPDKANLLPYSKTSGNGCFINANGSILTSPVVINPWLYDEDERKIMLQEVVTSKTIKGLNISNSNKAGICGETSVLSWLANGVINNRQNFIEANTSNECLLTDSIGSIIRSVKKALPLNAVAADYYYADKPGKHLHNTAEKYYGHFIFPKNGEILKDTFYARKDSF
ncbi:MAG TPA: FHA domain-containing protein, partial [Ferruginibacter sp.]|nr:FHA domain-containing protein [Ferruginibacter sp.]